MSAPAPPTAPGLFSRPPYWAAGFGTAPELPMSRAEMDALGWEACDVILVTGDAYIDHPSFGMAVIGRVLERQGFRVGIISQPDWHSAEPFRALGRPTLFFGVTAGNMDSLVNHYTSNRKRRNDDAYTPGGEGGRRPDRAVLVYAQRCREAFKGVPVVVGGIEASLRRIAQYDYWSDKVKRSVLPDSKADLLVYGNAERQIVEIAQRLGAGEDIRDLTDIRGTAFMRSEVPGGWIEMDSTEVDTPGALIAHPDPYAMEDETACADGAANAAPPAAGPAPLAGLADMKDLRHRWKHRDRTVIRLPAFEQVADDPILYAHASRVMHAETNPGNARALVQRHGERDVWLNPPPIPLTTPEIDAVFDLPYTRRPHTSYGETPIPAYDMIKHSVNIMRGCFGGCTFCSITEHEGRIIQSRSEESILREIENIRDKTPGFTGVISDLGGPTANMWRIACKSRAIEAACRLPSCVYPDICPNLDTDHAPLIRLYRRARAIPGIKKVLIASGLRYDLAVESPEYVKELVTHHVGGYLKIAPEHTEDGPLRRMMKPGVGSYEKFRALFEKYSRQAGKKQYLIPYFIAAHPGTTDRDMLNLALWLKRNRFKPDQVQTFLPTPMAAATAMYHSGRDTLRKVVRHVRPADRVDTVRSPQQRELHKAFLRWHDQRNWPLLRQALHRLGRPDLIGYGDECLVPPGKGGEGAAPRTGAAAGAGRSGAPGGDRGG
ncbi:YgiQ family radical SAM protein, partial [bacterium]|nr:YgiQ family radical SAM protein [bacterium]